MSEVHDREREARERVYVEFALYYSDQVQSGRPIVEALDAYRGAVEARVRWDQQADAEGYNIPGGPR